jgi:hypothetical protein
VYDSILDVDWLKLVRGLLAKFYQSLEHVDNAMLEVYDLVLLKGQ